MGYRAVTIALIALLLAIVLALFWAAPLVGFAALLVLILLGISWSPPHAGRG